MDNNEIIYQDHFILRDESTLDTLDKRTFEALKELKIINEEYETQLDNWIDRHRFNFIDWTGKPMPIMKSIKLMHCSICTKYQNHWNNYCKSCKYYDNDTYPTALEEEE